jgi:hypothetical protein
MADSRTPDSFTGDSIMKDILAKLEAISGKLEALEETLAEIEERLAESRRYEDY